MVGYRREPMWIFFWIIMGFIVGAPAKFLMPGKDPGGIFGTILIGSQELLSGVLLGKKVGLGTVTGFN
jgi:uncharacterized membrane protein YeaQ/YmgE (transglycosylase-associated protein family)